MMNTEVKVVVAYFKELFQHLPKGTEKNHTMLSHNQTCNLVNKKWEC